MLNVKTLLAAVHLVVLGWSGLGLPVAANDPTCPPWARELGVCPIDVSGEIDVDGVTVGGGGSGSSGDGSGSGSSGGGSDDEPWEPGTICDPLNPNNCMTDFETIVTEEVTINDVRRFLVDPGTALMEPDGWTIAGLHTNFYAHSPIQVASGQLLGNQAQVRFTPRAWLWSYGDGSSSTEPTAGRTWKQLGQHEFTRTATSHVYDRVGDYTIRLSIVFTAEYRWGSTGWATIPGSITLPANELYITAGTADTVLVDRDCLQNPSGPGCG